MAGTCAVIAAEKASQAAAGRGRAAGAGAGGVALMTAGSFLAAEGERGDGLAEGPGEGRGDHVAVFGGRDPGEVGDGGVQAEDLGDLGEGKQLAELGCPADLAVGLPVARLRAAVMARESMPSDRARS